MAPGQTRADRALSAASPRLALDRVLGGRSGDIPGLPAETQLTQSAEPPKAKTTVLLTQKLEGLPGFSVQVVLVEGPPGWVGGRHYHPGHVFVYMLDGTYQLNYDDLTSRTVLPGEVFYEAPNTIMRSKNGSSTEWVRDVVFQIIRDGEPPAVSVK